MSASSWRCPLTPHIAEVIARVRWLASLFRQFNVAIMCGRTTQTFSRTGIPSAIRIFGTQAALLTITHPKSALRKRSSACRFQFIHTTIRVGAYFFLWPGIKALRYLRVAEYGV